MFGMARQQLQRIHTPRSQKVRRLLDEHHDRKRAQLTKDLELTPEQQQQGCLSSKIRCDWSP